MPEDAPKISDTIMTALLQMFNSNSCKAGGVQEDALMAVSTLVEVLGESFLKYMEAFKPFLHLGLKNHAEYQVCGAAVGLTGDIARALRAKLLPYCDDIMMLLLENLGDNTVHRSVKPQILSVFGDVALAIGADFAKYLNVVLQTLAQASQVQVRFNQLVFFFFLLNLSMAGGPSRLRHARLPERAARRNPRSVHRNHPRAEGRGREFFNVSANA